MGLLPHFESFILFPNIDSFYGSGQDRQYTDFLKTRMPSGPFNPRSYFFNVPAPPESIIRDPLHEVMRMRVSIFVLPAVLSF